MLPGQRRLASIEEAKEPNDDLVHPMPSQSGCRDLSDMVIVKDMRSCSSVALEPDCAL